VNDYEQIGIDAYEIAEQIFQECNVPNDFSHQTGLVFGSTNRIKLTPRGWIADINYCTAAFIERFNDFQQRQ